MATYEFNGNTYDAPDDMKPEDAMKIIVSHAGQSSPGNTGEAPVTPQAGDPQSSPTEPPPRLAPTYQPVDGTIDQDTLTHNRDWLDASRIMYKKTSGTDFKGEDSDLAQFGLNQMGWLNYNLPVMGMDAAKIASAKPEEKQAFLYMMNTYDHLGMSWAGTWRMMKGMALDPTTYVGLGSFGLGSAAGQATKLASKEALKEALSVGIRTAAEGAMLAGAQDTIKQTAEMNADGKSDFSYSELAGSAATGAAMGGVLGGATSGLSTVLRKAKPWEAADALSRPVEAQDGKAATTLAKDAEKPATEAVSPTVGKAVEHPDGSIDLPEIDLPAKGSGEAEKLPVQNTETPTSPTQASEGLTAPIDGHGSSPSIAPDAPVHAPDTPEGANQVMQAIREVASDSGGRVIPRTFEETAKASSKAVEVLSSVSAKEMPAVVEHLRRQAVTQEERQLLHDTFAKSTTQLWEQSKGLYQQILATTDNDARQALTEQLAKIKSMRDAVQAGDTTLSSMDGRVLNQRKGQVNTGEFRETTEESILAEHGLTLETASPEARQWAEDEAFRRHDQWMNKVEQSDVIQQATSEVKAAYDSGDTALALQKSAELSSLKEVARRQELKDSGIATQALGMTNTALKVNNEYIISTVFTTSTLAVNTIPSIIKTVYRPVLDFAMKGPVDYAAYRQMTSTYTAMAQAVPMALRAAKAAFEYEKALLHVDNNRLLEADTVIRGRFGRTLRLFPRFLSATDEFFGQVNYRGFVMGQAVSDAVEHGHKIGLTGEALEAFVKQEGEKAAKHSFTSDIDSPHVIEFLRQTAMDKGYRGPKMEAWVQSQLDKNEDLFHTALIQAGKDYADDLMFKRRFSGDNWVSKAAKEYEGFVNRNPIMRMFGQLFFRTPVRVFEDGLRMTPGVNMLDPRIYADLLGKNGELAKVKAHGQMFLSYAIATWAITKYAEGKLTSGGPNDYKQRRGREDAGDWQPYSLRTGDQNFSFRNMDPFSTPLKIIANVMDRFNELEYRKSQGDYVDHQQKEALAWLRVSVGSIASAFQDANLMEGASELMKLTQTAYDPEHNDMTMQRWLASKAQLYIPNQINKAQQQVHPEIADPVSIEQYLRARINPSDPRVTKQYDVLGNTRAVAAPLGALDGINIASNKQLERDRTPKELAVLREVSTLELAANEALGVMPSKTDKFGLQGEDLRTIYTKDGKTYYDAVMSIYRTMPVTNALYGALITNKGGTVGTPDHPGSRVTTAKAIINAYREAALVRLYSQESGMRESFLRDRHNMVDAISGKHDVTGLAFR